MARILYSLAQNGRGHASRGYEIIRRLAEQGNKVMAFTGGDTYEPLEVALKGMPNVSLHRLPGFKCTYHKNGKIDYAKTFSKNVPTFMSSDIVIKKLKNIIDKYNFDFAISDFEPFLPRAAKAKKLRFITIDNQHKLVFGKLSIKKIRAKYFPSYLVSMGVIQSAHPFGSKCIIASVFKPELKRKKIGKTRIIVVGPLIRDEIEKEKKSVTKNNFVLIYVKPVLEKAIIPLLKGVDANFVMYVAHPEKYRKTSRITYEAHSAEGFAKDMARCKAVISSAGEQLMSEAIYLGKPLFLMPEGGQFEQIFNGYCVKTAGFGDYKDIINVEKDDIASFLKNLPAYESKIKKMKIINSIDEVMNIIYSELKKGLAQKQELKKKALRKAMKKALKKALRKKKKEQVALKKRKKKALKKR
ncbi:MAG TPA: glycosyltransferase family protein [Candidatus Nanoarchaeia archaeon]|nr:glycosyltransferase family protein [Candidatus Nanoarchaeia archaeon]